MVNTDLFQTRTSTPVANTVNEAGGLAYALPAEHALAQLAATGCFNKTFYTGAEDQLAEVLSLCRKVSPRYIAQTAIYAREQGHMKDMPALLCALLATRDPDLLVSTFARVIDNGRMLRNFVQFMRCGVTGRRSLGTRPKRLVRTWLAEKSPEALFRASVGNKPSLADVIKMVHPVPTSPEREALYGYLLGREVDWELLPALIRDFERFKLRGGTVPAVPFQMLTSLDLDCDAWTQIARNASWQMTRMNLNTFLRHGVFKDAAMCELVATRLADRSLIEQAKVFPYQLLAAYINIDASMPALIKEALEAAMEVAVDNVPEFAGRVAVLPDISGSMGFPVTGYRTGSTTKVTCVHIAALMAAAVMRRNRDAVVLPFDTSVRTIPVERADSILANAAKLAVNGGGTDCSAPLAYMNRNKVRADLVIFVSDNESWIKGGQHSARFSRATETMKQWDRYKATNPNARLVCLDIQPYAHTQAVERDDILNLGGFSDAVFPMIRDFAFGNTQAGLWVNRIKAIEV